MENIIEFIDVSFRYGEENPWILKDCSFSIKQGETVAIIGHNGSGKSTIAKLMNGLLFPEKGEVWVNGEKLEDETVWDIRKEVGMVFQNPDNQFVGTTVQDDVAFGMENRGMPKKVMEERIISSLQAVHMSSHRLTEPHRLSGGQKQRVAIAGVMAISPKIIILDEATVMLDPIGRVQVMETMNKLKQQEDLTLVTITHDLQEVIQAERVIVLNQGEIWKTGSPRDILKNGQAIQQIGLDLPFTIALQDELKKLEVSIPNHPLTIDEMLEEIWILHSNK